MAREQGREAAAGDTQHLRRLGLVPAGALQRRQDNLPLEGLQIEALDEQVGGSARARRGPARPR